MSCISFSKKVYLTYQDHLDFFFFIFYFLFLFFFFLVFVFCFLFLFFFALVYFLPWNCQLHMLQNIHSFCCLLRFVPPQKFIKMLLYAIFHYSLSVSLIKKQHIDKKLNVNEAFYSTEHTCCSMLIVWGPTAKRIICSCICAS